MPKTTTNLPALAESHIKATEDKIRKLQESGELDLPQDYSAANALRSAYLILQETTDMSNRPALEVCTSASIANSLFDMIVQGFNPSKDQCYFIVYGKQLTCQPSYFGAEALAKRVDINIADIVSEPVYIGDTLEYEIIDGKKYITDHRQTLDSVEGSKIKAAYAMTIDHAGEVTKTVIMTIDEIKAAWKQSKMKPITDDNKIKKGSTHEKFSGQMARRTVINRLCKDIVNTSSDKHLFRAVTRAGQVATEHNVQTEIEAKANKEFIDITSGEVIDAEVTAETPQPTAEKTEPQKSTEIPTEGKETPEPQENPIPAKEFGAENSIDTALRTGKEEKEQKQAEPKAKPKFVAELCEYLDSVPPAMREGAMQRVGEDSFPKLCEEDQDKIVCHYDELQEAGQQPEREF
ncbi:MAG: recombinase RecT [Proteobacteria bacterium]|nr:recombinase RecT [Pseudomonadota bacterium]